LEVLTILVLQVGEGEEGCLGAVGRLVCDFLATVRYVRFIFNRWLQLMSLIKAFISQNYQKDTG
jgi:hypothetical protein